MIPTDRALFSPSLSSHLSKQAVELKFWAQKNESEIMKSQQEARKQRLEMNPPMAECTQEVFQVRATRGDTLNDDHDDEDEMHDGMQEEPHMCPLCHKL